MNCVYESVSQLVKHQFDKGTKKCPFDVLNTGDGIPLKDILKAIGEALPPGIEVDTVYARLEDGCRLFDGYTVVPELKTPLPRVCISLRNKHAVFCPDGDGTTGEVHITIKAH